MFLITRSGHRKHTIISSRPQHKLTETEQENDDKSLWNCLPMTGLSPEMPVMTSASICAVCGLDSRGSRERQENLAKFCVWRRFIFFPMEWHSRWKLIKTQKTFRYWFLKDEMLATSMEFVRTEESLKRREITSKLHFKEYTVFYLYITLIYSCL